MMNEDNYSEVLKKKFRKNEDGSLTFEDGVNYSPNEIYRLKLIRNNIKNSNVFIEKVHMMKKFGFDLGIVLKNVC